MAYSPSVTVGVLTGSKTATAYSRLLMTIVIATVIFQDACLCVVFMGTSINQGISGSVTTTDCTMRFAPLELSLWAVTRNTWTMAPGAGVMVPV